MKGCLLSLKNVEKLGKYSRGYEYITPDLSQRVLLLKPNNEAKHVYIIPEFHTQNTSFIANAIYDLMHEDGKNRSSVSVKDQKAGRYDFYYGETRLEIYRKLCNIDEAQLLK